MTLHVLLVEDDRQLRLTVQSALKIEGFDVTTAVSVNEAAAVLAHAMPDVVLLDLELPDGDGMQVVELVRRRLSTPVLILSARHQEAEKVKLLDAGADDFLTKPFSMGELLARIRVAMRHRGTALGPTLTLHQHEGLKVDVARRIVEVDGRSIHLTPTEFRLLARLVRSAGRVVTHRQLLADVWGAEFTDHVHYLRLYMAQLRAKIEKIPAEPRYLLTEVGVGYRLAAD